MGTRVRKLAKELRRTPAEVLGLLHELGYLRYQSSEDMVADTAVQRLKKAAREAPRSPAPPVRPAAAPRPPPRRERAPEPVAEDLMARLVPGVVRTPRRDDRLQGARQRAAQEARASTPRVTAEREAPTKVQERRPPEAPPAEQEARLEVAQARLEAEQARLDVERAAVERLRGELEEARSVLQVAREELAQAREEVEQTRQALEAERAEVAAREPEGTPLVEVFEARGLRGVDEVQRALSSLAEGRHLGLLLGELRVSDARRLLRVLEDRLVLVGGEVPEALRGGAAVTVAPERADVPDARELGRRLDEVGEQLLLNGLRRVVLIGASPRWHRLLREGIDRRVEVQFRARPDSDGLEPGRGDAVICWRAVLPDALRQDWARRQVVVIEVGEVGLEAFLVSVRDRLRGG